MPTPAPPAPRPSTPDLQFEAQPVAHLPLVRAIVAQLEIPAVLDELLPADPRNRVTDAECVTVMLLNILQGRVALYDMDQWLAGTDVELLFGTGVEAGFFNDARLAACLDHIAEVGTEKVLSGVVKRYLTREDAPSSYTIHQDTTSVVLHGAYDDVAYRAIPARGYSKDHRPDLKQLVFGLSLHGSCGIPLVSTMFSGNTADPVANRFHIEALGDLLPEQDDVTLVGDCKLVDGQTIGALLLQRFHFVSLVPHTFAIRAALVEEVRAAGVEMPELARGKGRTQADEPRVYRGRSFDREFTAGWPCVGDNVEREVQLRFLVVESSQLEEKEEAALKRRLDRERETFAKELAVASKRPYSCESDAMRALDKMVGKLKFHTANVAVVPEVITAKRSRRGRPTQGEPAPSVTQYLLKEVEPLAESADAVELLRFQQRHFVLITDHLDREAWPDERILAEYRHQHIIEGHTGFRWLKNIATVAPMFLHTPSRIAALGVVLMLALMVRNYIQFELRRQLIAQEKTVPSRLRRPTTKPTTETAMIPFARIMSVHPTLDGQPLGRQVAPLPPAALVILAMLGVSEDVFRTPPSRIFRGPPRGTSGM